MSRTSASLPLQDLLVIDFSQFLSGPSCTLRLADLGARVIKIERPGTGDICRTLYVSNLVLDGDSSIFHAINRNKESFAANLKDEADARTVKELVKQADVVIHNFRPGVMERLGFDYESVKAINPSIVYGEITGYGKTGPWKDLPGQDLLVQSLSGLVWLNGDDGQPPMPFGLATADMMAGAHLAQGILASLVRRSITGHGARVEVSLLESTLDFQFTAFTTFLNDGGKLPKRSSFHNAHAYLDAPYGIYETADGYIALAICSLHRLGEWLECSELASYPDAQSVCEKRDEIKAIIAKRLAQRTTADWLARLEPAGIWCAEVLDWDRLVNHEGFKVLDMVQQIKRKHGHTMLTTRCPIRIDGNIYKSAKGSPRVGEHTGQILKEVQSKP